VCTANFTWLDLVQALDAAGLQEHRHGFLLDKRVVRRKRAVNHPKSVVHTHSPPQDELKPRAHGIYPFKLLCLIEILAELSVHEAEPATRADARLGTFYLYRRGRERVTNLSAMDCVSPPTDCHPRAPEPRFMAS
jgi:hypothetical protein